MEAGYDPARIRQLSFRTLEAIETLRVVRSQDPLAADAIRAARLARHNLEDLWLPSLRAIERSEAMVTWAATRVATVVLPGARLPPAGRLSGGPATVGGPLARLGDDELVARLRWFDRVLGDPTGAGPSVDAARFRGDLDDLACELARRVAIDAGFADRLVATAATTVLVGQLLDRASFPMPFVASVVRAMAWPRGPQSTANLDGYGASASAALAVLAGDPAACLDLLLDPVVLYEFAAWDRLDNDVVADVVVAGLHRAVMEDPRRLADGYAVLGRLVELANGPLDHGMRPGMARGVAVALAGYVDTLAPALFTTGDGPVLVSNPETRVHVELGTYDEVAALLGAVLRDAEAAARLGVVTAAYADHVLTDLGADVLRRPGLSSVVSFTVLVEDAAAAERSQLVLEAAAAEGSRRRLGAVVGFGLTAVLAASGVGTAARGVVSQVVRLATDALARVDPRRLPDGSIGSQIFGQITLTTVAAAVADPAVLRASGASPLTRAESAWLRRRLDVIDRCDDRDERARLVSELEQHIDQQIPRLGGHLDVVRAHGQLDQLR
jgi:hypothetical protein